jgi:hypothetical protein
VATGALAAVVVDTGYGGGGEDWTCSGFGIERTFGTSRLDSIGGGSGGSPDLRSPCPVGTAVLPASTDVIGGVTEGAASEVGLACASSVTGGTGGGGGGGGADTAGNPARNFSSLYFAFVRSAIRLCVSLSRSAPVSARLGGGGTVARLG